VAAADFARFSATLPLLLRIEVIICDLEQTIIVNLPEFQSPKLSSATFHRLGT